MGRGVGMAAVGGVVGAIIWGAVAYWTGWSIGFLALIVGALVGAGMQWGVRKRGSVGTGLLASLIAVLSIVGAKFIVGQAVASDRVTDAANVTEDDALDHYAVEVFKAFEATGQYMGEPDESGWPPEVMAEAMRLWGETPERERDEYIAALSRDAVRAAVDGRFHAGAKLFALSFGPINLVIIAMAAAAAYRTGKYNIEAAEEVLVKPDVPDANGLVGGPLSRSGPASGGSSQSAAPKAPQPAKARKGKAAKDADDDDAHTTGIFGRLAAIEAREQKRSEVREETRRDAA